MTRLEHGVVDVKAPQNQNSTTRNSLGPVDPSWLAKLSGQLGIQPARTVAPLLMSIWPGVHAAAICCREACAYLMQADLHHVPMPQLESNIRAAFRHRGMPVHPSLSIRAEIEADSHFIKEPRASDGEVMVRLDKASLPAPAVASLYLNGNGSRMLTPERALYQTAIHLTWPRALTDDDEYLCCQISELLIEDVERVGIDRNLPRHSMHLTEVGGALRQRSEFDPRLAVIFPKGQLAKSRRPRLSEFLGKDDLKPLFRVVESRLRQSEKVVTLRTDVLLRSLGPMASVLQKSLAPAMKDGPPLVLPDPPRSGKDHDYTHAHTPSFPLPIPATKDQPHSKGPKADTVTDAMSPATGRDSVWSYSGPDPLQSRHASVSRSFTRAQSLFMGLESASEVPIEIRNCWSTIEDDPVLPGEAGYPAPGRFAAQCVATREASASGVSLGPVSGAGVNAGMQGASVGVGASPGGTPVMEIPQPHPSHSSVRTAGGCGGGAGAPGPRGEGQEGPGDDSSEALLLVAPGIARTEGGSVSEPRKAATEPSDFFSFGSEDMSDAGGGGGTVAGESTPGAKGGLGGGSTHSGVSTRAMNPWGRVSNSSGACHAPSADSPQQFPNGAGLGPGRLSSIGVSHLTTSVDGQGTGPGNIPQVGTDAQHGTVWSKTPGVEPNGSIWATPPGSMAGHGGGDARYASHLSENAYVHMRGAGGHMEDITSIAGNVWGPPASPGSAHALPATAAAEINPPAANYAAALRSAGAHSGNGNYDPRAACNFTNEVIHAHLDACGREVHGLMSPALLDTVCDAVRRAGPRLNAPSLLQASMQHSVSTAAMPGGAIGPIDVASEFMACVNALALTRPPLAGLLERVSDSTKRALVVAGLPPGVVPIGAPASTLAALKPTVRREVVALVDANPGILRLSHFDGGVLCHLQRRPEQLVAAALREISRRTDLPGASNKSAYLTHWLMRFADDPSLPSLAAKSAGKTGGGASPDLRRLPRGVQAAVERLVAASPWIDWRHFDAGVMKVLQQLAAAAEADTIAEVRQIEVTELSSVKNMPAYLNKCFNNRLWKVRES